MALTPEEIQHRLDFEILVDCYDEYEMASAWQIYFEETLEFPFTATARLKKRGGFEESKTVTVVGIPDNGQRYLDHEFNIDIDNEGYIVKIPFESLSDIQASEETIEALEVWTFWIA